MRCSPGTIELALLAAVAADDRVRAILGGPARRPVLPSPACCLTSPSGHHDRRRGAQLRAAAGRKRSSAEPFLPSRTEFVALKASTERRVVAKVASYRKMTQAQEKQILDALSARFGCEVELDCSVDESLMGGAVIRAGDVVIDGSVRGQLSRLAANLSR
jgi:F-type H+-transporting ATPase subunit delta